MSDDDEGDDDDANRVGAGARRKIKLTHKLKLKPRGAEAQTGPRHDISLYWPPHAGGILLGVGRRAASSSSLLSAETGFNDYSGINNK